VTGGGEDGWFKASDMRSPRNGKVLPSGFNQSIEIPIPPPSFILVKTSHTGEWILKAEPTGCEIYSFIQQSVPALGLGGSVGGWAAEASKVDTSTDTQDPSPDLWALQGLPWHT
jgi:hypothetical protein